MGIIYKITSPTGRLYVGKTTHLARRKNTYKYNIANNVGWVNSMIMNSLQKYGWEAHIFEIIEEIQDEKLNEREIFWIKELHTYCFENPKNMNMSRGGEDGGRSWLFDEPRRKEQSKKFTGDGNPFYGKAHSDKTKEVLSKIMSKRNREKNIRVPKWGAEKGRLKVIKGVVVYNNLGNFIGEYESLVEASIKTGLKIQAIKDSAIYGSWIEGGYLVKYKTDDYPLKIEVGNITKQTVKRPVLFFMGNSIIEYPSSLEASQDLKIPKTTINRAAYYNKFKPIRSGHVFIYTDLYAEILKQTA